MPAETPSPHRLDKRAILAAFGDRVLVQPQARVEKEYLNLDPHLTQQSLVSEGIVDKKVSYERSLGGTRPIHLKIRRRRDLYGNLSYVLEAKDSAQKEGGLGSFVLFPREDGNFDLPHRYVVDSCRGSQNESGESIGDIMLAACEQIVRATANRERQAKILEVEAGQLDTMIWLSNNGFKPKTNQDAERFTKICNADPNLCIAENWYVVEKEKYYLGMKQKETYRVAFVKTVQPSAPQMTKADLADEKAAHSADANRVEEIRESLGK